MALSGRSVQHLALILACAVPVLGAFLVSSGVFIIDELIYLHSAAALANQGTLIVDNGYAELGSDDLRLWLMIDGPNGLTPQYPPGLAALGLPFYAIMGARGLILLNAIAAAGVALLTWAIARKLYRNATVATVAVLALTFCTFHLEYAWGIWPHMTGVFFVLLAFYLALHAMGADQARTVLGHAIGSGLAVGAGLLFRVDTILILAVIGIAVLFAAKRPFLTILGGAIGLIPGFATAAVINAYKFGTYNFLSYGRSGGGGDSLSGHLVTAVILAAGIALVFLIRRIDWTPPRLKLGLAILVLGAAALMAVPEVRTVLFRILKGYYTLFVDLRLVKDPRVGVVPSEDGALMFWGVAKKALFQSLPWLAVLAALLLASWKKADVRPHALLLLFAVIWSLPFAAYAWHGGFGSNMRYFLPMIPALVILGAALVVDLASRTGSPAAIAAVGILAGLAVTFLLYDTGAYDTDGTSQQILTFWVFVGLALLVGAATLLGRRTRSLNAPALMGVAFGMGVATFGSVFVDVAFSQRTRAISAAGSALARDLSGPMLIYGHPKLFAFAADRPDIILGVQGQVIEKVDVDLFETAIKAGYRTLTTIETAEYVTSVTGLRYVAHEISPEGGFVEIVAAPPEAQEDTALRLRPDTSKSAN